MLNIPTINQKNVKVMDIKKDKQRLVKLWVSEKFFASFERPKTAPSKNT